jgi:transposase-like protein
MAEGRTKMLECPRCASRDVININLSLEHGDRVAFYSCHRCDKRWWHKDGAPVDLPEVLEMAKRKQSQPPTA